MFGIKAIAEFLFGFFLVRDSRVHDCHNLLGRPSLVSEFQINLVVEKVLHLYRIEYRIRQLPDRGLKPGEFFPLSFSLVADTPRINMRRHSQRQDEST